MHLALCLRKKKLADEAKCSVKFTVSGEGPQTPAQGKPDGPKVRGSN